MRKKLAIIVSVILVIAMVVVTVIVNQNASTRGTLTGAEKNITINVFDKQSQEIYNEKLKTDNKYLLEVLNETEELNVVTESGPYGAYITSIKGIDQGDNFYWSYYINNEYATIGVSNCKIEDGKTYSFKIEKVL